MRVGWIGALALAGLFAPRSGEAQVRTSTPAATCAWVRTATTGVQDRCVLRISSEQLEPEMCWTTTSTEGGDDGDQACRVVTSSSSLAQNDCEWIETATTGGSIERCWAKSITEEETQRVRVSKSADDVNRKLETIKQARETQTEDGVFSKIPRLWGDLDDWLTKKLRLSVGVAYTALAQTAIESTASNPGGGGGDLDFFGRWQPYADAENETLVGYSFEVRHDFGGDTPSTINERVGSINGTTLGFNREDFVMTQLWWEQHLFSHDFTARFGKVDITDRFNTHRYETANFSFLNTAFSFRPATPTPSQGFGFFGVWRVLPELYAVITMADANADKTKWNFFETFVDYGDVFLGFEFGYETALEGHGSGDYHLAVWTVDEREEAGVPAGAGFGLHVEQMLLGTLVPFARYNYSNSNAAKARHHVVLGVGVERIPGRDKDRLGVAFAWTQPHDEQLREELTTEFFYRVQMSTHWQITPDLQLIHNPAANRNSDWVGVLGLRVRAQF